MASVGKRANRRWEVRWREGGRNRSRSFARKGLADAFRATVEVAAANGSQALLPDGRETLAEFAKTVWFPLYQEQRAPHTVAAARRIWNTHILENLGGYRLCELNVELIEEWTSLLRRGRSDASVRRYLAVLSACLSCAARRRRIAVNPCHLAELPKQRRRTARANRIIGPKAIETMRAELIGKGRHQSAVFVSLLAYAGLRPGEALALRWADVGKRVLRVDKAIALGEEGDTKTGAPRSVRLLAPLAADLAAWKARQGLATDDALILPRRDGQAFRDHDYRNWRRRHFAPAARAAQALPLRPYDLRHAFASLLLHEQAPLTRIAENAGHSVAMLASTYAHVIAELEEEPSRPAADVIADARAAVRSRYAGEAKNAPNARGRGALSPADAAFLPT